MSEEIINESEEWYERDKALLIELKDTEENIKNIKNKIQVLNQKMWREDKKLRSQYMKKTKLKKQLKARVYK